MRLTGSRTLHWNSPMPQAAVRQHHESPSRGDNYGAIRRAQHGFYDGNMQYFLGIIWMMHWPTPARNGYTRVVDTHTGKTRRMTLRERRRPAGKWGVDGIRRWRRPNGEYPITYEEAITYGSKIGACCIGEMKSRAFAEPKVAAMAVAAAKKHDHPAWFKTLYNMKYPQAKTAAVRLAGGQMALIFGRFVKGRAARVRVGRRFTAKWKVKPHIW